MQEIFNTIALTQITNIGTISAKFLYDAFGSATAVMENRNNISDVIPDASARIVAALKSCDDAFRIAEKEIAFIEEKKIKALCINDAGYPVRLKECVDAPVVLFYYGNTDLNKGKIISMVGTRKCTGYGKDLCRSFVSEMKSLVPDAIIVSGLAYGIDVNCHRAALDNDMRTVGVVAHGLEKIYPAAHRDVAGKMVQNGGILTEYIHGTSIEKGNFLRRNRIVAGMADCTVVVESASHGGSLVTADLASGYDRDVFAFPGRIFDENSRGCNMLIKSNKAMLIESADDLVKSMGWKTDPAPKAVQQDLFGSPDSGLSGEEQAVVMCLKDVDNKSLNMLSNETGLSFAAVSSVVFDLESKGLVETIGGARVRLRKR